VDDLDVVAGIVEQVVGPGLLQRKMRRDQREVDRAQPPQQVVVGAFDAVSRPFVSVHPDFLAKRPSR
jgi:hypothetical protein